MVVGATIFGLAGTRLNEDEHRFFAASQPWGFILFSRNIGSGEALRRLTADLRAAVGRAAPVLIDQEGGRVQRLRPPLARAWGPALDEVARAGAGAARAMWLRYRIIAAELAGFGIDVNCAPLADIAWPGTHPFLRNRCYATSARCVAEMARAVADGLLAGGVLPVLKHVPGHGRATSDSHLDLPHVDASHDELSRTDFAPFRALADLPLAMTAHVVYADIDPAPATVSACMIRLVREEIGFSGCLMSDDISMQAIAGGARARATAAMAAGCDLVLHCNGDLTEMQAVAEAAGDLSGKALTRARAAEAARRAPEPVDIGVLEAELGALQNDRRDDG